MRGNLPPRLWALEGRAAAPVHETSRPIARTKRAPRRRPSCALRGRNTRMGGAGSRRRSGDGPQPRRRGRARSSTTSGRERSTPRPAPDAAGRISDLGRGLLAGRLESRPAPPARPRRAPLGGRRGPFPPPGSFPVSRSVMRPPNPRPSPTACRRATPARPVASEKQGPDYPVTAATARSLPKANPPPNPTDPTRRTMNRTTFRRNRPASSSPAVLDGRFPSPRFDRARPFTRRRPAGDDTA